MASAKRRKRPLRRQNSPQPLQTYEQAVHWLESHYNLEQHLGGKRVEAPSLKRMSALMELLGNPQHDIPAIHVTGTNGKGSTCRMLTEIIGATGLKVGSYSSPHIERVNDRIMIGNEPVDDESFLAAIAEIADIEPWVIKATDETPSYFEVICAAAYNWFAASAVDVNVIEVGMGGKWDATNVIEADVAVITNVGPDHLEIIGPTVAEVAQEKSGIISKRSHVICGETDPALVEIISKANQRATWRRSVEFELSEDRLAVGGRLIDLRTSFGQHAELFLPVNGSHQAENATLAVAAAEAFFGRHLDSEVIQNAFDQLKLPARFEIVSRQPTIIIDGAHNAPAATVVAETLFNDFASEDKPILVIGLNEPREPSAFVQAIGGTHFSKIIATAADWPRAIPADQIAAELNDLDSITEIQPEVSKALDRALQLAGDAGTILITGSLYLAAQARAQLAPPPR